MSIARTLGAVMVAFSLLPGCAGSGSRAPDSPLAAARRADLPPGQRVNAIREVKAQIASGQEDRLVARYAMKEMAWALDTPEIVRAAALESILWDEREEGDSLQIVREMLPTEPGRGCVAVLSTAAADHGWTEATPALVRSLARLVEGVPDTERAEYQALEKLHPGQDISQVALGVFMNPATEPGPAGLRLDMRVREAAWDLVGRLAPDRDARSALLDTAPAGDDEGARILDDLRLVRDALGVVPKRGDEVRWALRLIEERDGRLKNWWRQATDAVASLGPEGRQGLELRHVEAVRWAAQQQPQWLNAGRAALLDQMAARLEGRQTYPRTKAIEGLATANAERLSTERDRIGWGDALVLLVLDHALAEQSVIAEIFNIAEIDHDDRATEHGGMLWADAAGFHAQHFPPRGTPTPDDRRFVAPREMIDYSSAALAHFHFHVADWRNRDYAGPSPGDMDYAAAQGRVCLVFTGLSRGVLNADVYFPGGAVVDLGEVRAPDR